MVKYQISDHLSARVITDSSGTVVGQRAHYSFGETWYETGTTTKWQFTSYERDGESGNDYAMFRSYVNRLGRFSSPDPIAGSLSDPQSLNRYAYVVNDPVNLVDPLGLWPDGMIIVYGQSRGCTLNGIQTDCGFALGFVANGSAVICPYDDCFGFQATVIGGTIYRVVTHTARRWVTEPYDMGPQRGSIPLCNCVIRKRETTHLDLFTVGRAETYYYESFLRWASNFAAGAGDVLSLGITAAVREGLTPAQGVVNYSSGAYVGGAVTGTAIGTAIGATGAAVAGGKYGALFGRGGAFFNRGPVRFGWYWDKTKDAIGLRIGAARGTSWWSHIPFYWP